jgi:carboxymethylenebutenolidase
MADQNVTSSMLEIPGPQCAIRAFEARPAAAGTYSAVIVIQEWWGLNDHIKDIAMRFAREGYVAMAPDLYSRQGNKVTATPDEAGQLMMNLDKKDGVADLLAVVAHLKKTSGINGDCIGVAGFCMGGSYALLLPCHSPDIKAAAPFYGEIPPNETLKKLGCPVRYFYGDEDAWIQAGDVERLRTALHDLGKAGDVVIYKGVPHAFFNDTRKEVYRPEQAKDAWKRTLSLFARELKPG